MKNIRLSEMSNRVELSVVHYRSFYQLRKQCYFVEHHEKCPYFFLPDIRQILS